MSAQYGSFDTHNAMVYDILCPMVCVIKCHKMTKNAILRHFMTHAIWHKMSSTIAIWVSKEPYQADKLIYENKTNNFHHFWIVKCKKLSEHIFLCIFEPFSADSFVNLNSKSTQEDQLQIRWNFVTYLKISHYKRISSMKKIGDKKIFLTPPSG